jgi:hypothetical protein
VTISVARIALIAVAAVVLAWLAFGFRAVRLEDQADAVVKRAHAGKVSTADVRQARDRLHEAERLNPDRSPDLTEGELLYAIGRDREAVQVGRAVIADEPENTQAWYLAYAAERNRSVRLAALARLRQLNPWIEVVLGLRRCPVGCVLRRRP